jgi:hypothetical protein
MFVYVLDTIEGAALLFTARHGKHMCLGGGVHCFAHCLGNKETRLSLLWRPSLSIEMAIWAIDQFTLSADMTAYFCLVVH